MSGSGDNTSTRLPGTFNLGAVGREIRPCEWLTLAPPSVREINRLRKALQIACINFDRDLADVLCEMGSDEVEFTGNKWTHGYFESVRYRVERITGRRHAMET